MLKRHLQTLFLFLGVGLFLFLLYKMNLKELGHELATLDLKYLAFLMGYTFIWRFCHALAFFILCGLPGTRLGAYIVTQILSNTVSDLFLVGNVGGEVYRAYKMSQYYPAYRTTFWGMTLIYNIYYALAMMFVFLTSGFILFFAWDFPTALKISFTILTFLLLLLAGLFLYLQSRGLLSQFVAVLGRLPFAWAKNLSRFLLKRTLPIDRSVKNFHRKEPGRTFWFIFLMYLSRMLTIGEPIIIGLSMGIHITFLQAVLINLVDSFVRIAFFLVPNGQLGVIEAAMTSLGGVVGQSSTMMFGFSLVQRIRVLFWDGIGLGLMALEKKKGKLYGTSLDA